MTTPHQTKFVVLEGLDATGTTTQAEALEAAFAASDVPVCRTAEPSGGPIGILLREHIQQTLTLDPMATALAFTADRADHLARVIRPALRDGRTVICDRYLLSTLAYQGADGVDRGWILRISQGFDVPDLTVWLDVAEDERRRRLGSRGHSERYDGTDDDAGRLRAAYEESAELLASAGHRIVRLDGSLPAKEITREILDLLGMPAVRLD